MNRGDIITEQQYRRWVERLNAIRTNHGLSIAPNVSPPTQGTAITASKMNQLINSMRNGITSNWMNVYMTSQYPVNAGDPISYDVAGNIEIELTNWEKICPNNSSFNSAHKASNFSSNFTSHFSSNKSSNYSPENTNDSGAWGLHGSCDWFNETYYGNKLTNGTITSRY